MTKNIWTPGQPIDGDLSYRLIKAFIFKFFHDDIYYYPIYQDGKPTRNKEMRFDFSGRYYFSDENVYTLDNDIFNNSEIKNQDLILFRPFYETNMFKVNDKLTVRLLRYIKFHDISDFYKKQKTGYYHDVDEFMYLFDTSFSWCIKISHDIFFGQEFFNEIKISIKILSKKRAPLYIVNMINNKC